MKTRYPFRVSRAHFLWILALAVGVLLVEPSVTGTAADKKDSGVPPGYSSKIIQVKFKEGTKVIQPGALLPQNLRKSVASVTRLFTLSEEEMDNIGASGLNLWFQITLKPGTNAAAFIEDLKRLESVEIVQPAPLPAPPP